MPNYGKGFLLVLGLMLFVFTTNAQEASPYSRFGLGDQVSSRFAASKAMGGLSATYRDNFNLNPTNPASLSSLSLSTLEFGINASSRKLGAADSTYRTGDGFIDYFALGFPVNNRTGISIGLVPFSQMNYDFEQVNVDSSFGEYTSAFNGNGRLYDLYAGGSFKWTTHGSKLVLVDTSQHQFSVGFTAAYQFGRLNYREEIILSDSTNGFNTRQTSTLGVSDVKLRYGFQYRTRINDEAQRSLLKSQKKVYRTYYMTLGAYATNNLNFKANYFETVDREGQINGSPIVIDTLVETDGIRYNLNTPTEVGFGISFSEESRWMIGADFSYTLWSGFTSPISNVALSDSWRISIGGELTPNILGKRESTSENLKGFTAFLARSQYRIGGYYDRGYLSLGGEDISEFGITFGLGFAVGWKRYVRSQFTGSLSKFNISFEVGKRGTSNLNLIDENFFRATVGFTLNDRWFQKRKYN